MKTHLTSTAFQIICLRTRSVLRVWAAYSLMSRKDSRKREREHGLQQAKAAAGYQETGPTTDDKISRHGRGSRLVFWAFGLGFLMLGGIGAFVLRERRDVSTLVSPSTTQLTNDSPGSRSPLTFSKDVAPVIFNRCTPCHRPGQIAPFSFLAFQDVQKRARQIAEVTARRYMPPWLPEPGFGDFAESRRLTDTELGLIQEWVAQGTVEGNPSDLPPLPKWKEGWQLGEPDLIVQMSQTYTLGAEGKDVYRNFVFPIPVSGPRYVKGVEFLPGNPRVVHHAFINIDETRQSRRLAEKQTPPGFDGMEMPDSVMMPGGQLLGWQPGKMPYFGSEGLSWVLKTNTDLVLQMHMNPSGKPEEVRPTVGFYFTHQAPTNTPFRIKLADFEIDIPAGATNYAVEQSYVLPVDVTLLRVSAHAHYLGKTLRGWAALPDGSKKWLISIPDWDFFWQGDYKYAEPVSLPKGTRLVMHFTYDNSVNNPRNPHHPPERVRYGLQSKDEMAELFFQALARTPRERAILSEDYLSYLVRTSIRYFDFLIALNPQDASAHMRLGRALSATGQSSAALPHLMEAVKLKPDNDQAHYELAFFYLLQNRFTDAYPEFLDVIRLNPGDNQAYGNLGYICLRAGRLKEAEQYFETALRLNPDDAVARKNLGLMDTLKNQPKR
jgi:thioredoxin-like negative regulator of GroEL